MRTHAASSHTATSFAKKVGELMPVLHRSLAREQQDLLSKGYISFPQSVVLELLAAQESCTMTEIARSICRPKSAATAMIDSLVQMGLVKRWHADGDRRLVNVSATAKGRHIAQTIHNEMITLVDRLFAPLTADEKRAYLAILEKITGNIQKQ